MAYRTIGNTVVEWDDDAPFVFTMREESGPEDSRFPYWKTIDMTPLRTICEDPFLLQLKESVIEMRNQCSLSTVSSFAQGLSSLIQKLSQLDCLDAKVSVIDEGFLLCIASVQERVPRTYLATLRKLFLAKPSSPLFAHGLQRSDFPIQQRKKGWHGTKIDNILAKALSQAAVAQILDQCDSAYAKGAMDIGLYSFAHLAFAVFCRPNSYRQIRISDFNFDPQLKQYTVQIPTSKSGEHSPSKTIFTLNEPLGVLLTKQRQHVIATYGHLVRPEEVGHLAMFPARMLSADKSRWLSSYANHAWGMLPSGDSFGILYARKIKSLLGDESPTINANALRHTVGTLLAQSGASAKTIQAVLRHADDQTCKAYVDIAFHGMMGELSRTIRPAFEAHLPALIKFRSKTDSISEEKRIRSEDLETGEIEDTGECGKAIACENAPIVCYGCFRFRPFWDVDHSINLKIAQREIDDMEMRGKPFEHMLKRARVTKQRIVLIMNASDRYRDAMHETSHGHTRQH